MSILAIDFGSKRLGLAISEGILAEPLKVLPNNENVFENLKKFCRQHSVEKIILGLPEGKLRAKVLSFAKKCRQLLKVEVEFENEILTTAEAEKLLIEGQVLRKKRKKIIDAVAAAVILQRYLDREKR